jgi:aromatic amino acid aminotransferase I
LWITLDYESHPLLFKKPETTALEIEDIIFQECIKEGVLLAKGSFFIADRSTEAKKVILRATFASADKKTMATAIERFGAALREEWQL